MNVNSNGVGTFPQVQNSPQVPLTFVISPFIYPQNQQLIYPQNQQLIYPQNQQFIYPQNQQFIYPQNQQFIFPQTQQFQTNTQIQVVTAPQNNSVQPCHESATINPLDLIQVKMEPPSQGENIFSNKHDANVVTAPQNNSVQPCHESASINPLDLVQVKMEPPSQEDTFSNKHDANTVLLPQSAAAEPSFIPVNSGPSFISSDTEIKIEKQEDPLFINNEGDVNSLNELPKSSGSSELFGAPISCSNEEFEDVVYKYEDLPSLSECNLNRDKDSSVNSKEKRSDNDRTQKLKCNFCPKKFRSQLSFTEHQKTHIKCTLCDYYSNSRADIQHHLFTHTKLAFKCQFCEKKFGSNSTLNLHIAACHKPPPPSRADKNILLRLNKVDDTPKRKKKHDLHCNICSKSFHCRLYSFKNHLRIHENNKNYKCKTCNFKTLTKADLNRHLRTHSDDHPHLCHFCGKSFKNTRSLDSHIDIFHTEIKPFKCEDCDKCFSKGYLLKAHSKMHDKGKPFKCSICDKGYKNKRGLKDHIFLQHVDNKPFKCPDCEECFSKPKLLKAHSISHLDAESLQELDDLLEYNLS